MAVTSAPPPATSGLPPGVSGRPLVGRHDVFRRQLARLGWGFSAPALIFIALVTVFPIVYSVIISFRHVLLYSTGFHMTGFTLNNYSKIIHYGPWRYAVAFTVGYTVVTVLVELVLGMGIAMVLDRLSRGRGIMMALLLLPWSLITVISARLWQYLYDPSVGAASKLVQLFGAHNPVILGHNASAIIALMVADIWKTTPFVAIILLAGLVMLPRDVYEAAEVDGASEWATFFRITLPMLAPTIGLAILFRVLQAFGLFDLPNVLTGGGPGHATTSLAILGYQAMFEFNQAWGPGAAIATSTALLVVLGCLCFYRVFKAQAAREVG